MHREPTIQELRMLDALMEHSRTSCGAPHTGESNAYFNESGHPRCDKCAIQFRINHGHWPDGGNLVNWNLSANIRFTPKMSRESYCDVTTDTDGRPVMFECRVKPGGGY